MQSTIPNFKHLSQIVLQLQIFSDCLCICMLQTQEPLAYGHFGPSDLNLNKIGKDPLGNALNKIGKGPLGNTTYLISSI